MAENITKLTRETFSTLVHEALNHLYDSSYLQTHRLADLLIDESILDTQRSQQLRRVLLNAVLALRPAEHTPLQAPDWRAYQLLELRFVEGLGSNEVMEQLAIGRALYFREQARILDRLTEHLWRQLQESQHAPSREETTHAQLTYAEMERVYVTATHAAVDLVQVVRELGSILAPLAHTKQVTLRYSLLEALVLPQADRVLLRQIVLTMVTSAIDSAPGGVVEVHQVAVNGEFGIGVRVKEVKKGTQGIALVREAEQRLDSYRPFLPALGARFHVEVSQHYWEIRLLWTIEEPQVLLVVDDNQGIIDLLQRYLTGHGWRVIGATDGSAARTVLGSTQPAVIILDVMMPREDGWELLQELRARADTRTIPILICSVLNEVQVALTLGANGYLLKPVTQAALLQALAPWAQHRPNRSLPHAP